MKFDASTQNAFSFGSALPLVGQWETRTAKRSSFVVRPFELPGERPETDPKDDLARKQEVVCAIILCLCLLFTVAVCFWQLSAF